MKIPARWLAIGLFVFSSALNYLDRQLLAALEGPIRAEFNWSYADYGLVVGYFSIVYALAAPLMGLLIDRIGLNAGVTVAVGGWSLATLWTGFSGGVRELIASRLVLGLAQGGGIPASGKSMSTYLEPSERALGNAMSQIGISVGLIAAPLLAGVVAPAYGWRAPFLIGASLGLVWIPLWWWMARVAPKQPEVAQARRVTLREMLGLRTYWGLVIATMLGMTVYSLWTNFTTAYFVRARGLNAVDVNRTLAWIPPLIGSFGGVIGGAFSMRLIRGGSDAASARRRAALIGAVLVAVTTASIPFAPSAAIAVACIAVSYFCSTALSVNLYALPIDIFGRERAAFGVASLTCAYGLMQVFFSPWVGRVIDQQGFDPACWAAAIMPISGVGVLYLTKER
ncbi:MAG: MFS transporter [Acidobacteria bacterium]|nr:MFS transporter [Acidobacteriota bacterium]